MGQMAFGLAAADDVPRAASLLEQIENFWYDHLAAYSLEYSTGFSQSGSYYAWIRTLLEGPLATQYLDGSVSGFPDLSTSGPRFYAPLLNRIYDALPLA